MWRCQIAVVDFSKSKVSQFHNHVRSMVLEQQILRFDITVCYVVVVTMQQRLGNLPNSSVSLGGGYQSIFN